MVIGLLIVACVIATYFALSTASFLSLMKKYESVENIVLLQINKAQSKLWFQQPNYSIRQDRSYTCSRNPDDMCKKDSCNACPFSNLVISNKLVFPDLKKFLAEIKVSRFFLVNFFIRKKVKEGIFDLLHIHDVKEIVNE